MTLATPVSSSSVRKITPFAVPGRWRTSTSPATVTLPPNGARVTVAGLVLVRQRPGTANGVIFLTLEDETGVANVIVWRKAYEAFRRAVVSGRCLRVTGPLQRESGVVQIIAEKIEDISFMLDDLARPPEPGARLGAALRPDRR